MPWPARNTATVSFGVARPSRPSALIMLAAVGLPSLLSSLTRTRRTVFSCSAPSLASRRSAKAMRVGAGVLQIAVRLGLAKTGDAGIFRNADGEQIEHAALVEAPALSLARLSVPSCAFDQPTAFSAVTTTVFLPLASGALKLIARQARTAGPLLGKVIAELAAVDLDADARDRIGRWHRARF